MGLLDSILAGGGYGGLLGSNYTSPLFTPEKVAQPQYDALGNYTGITPQVETSPFPAQPIAPGSFQPATPFNGQAPAAPFNQFAGIPVGPSAPEPAPAAPPADANAPSGYMRVGDYNMPQFGPRELYQPQQAQLPPNATPTQGQMPPQQPADLPPALGGGGQQNGFLRGLQSIGNGGGLISALTGNYNDPVSIQRANLKAQFDALVPLVGPQKAMLAVMNPEAGKTILAQALEKKQFGFTKLDNDTVLRTDPLTGKAEIAYGGAASGTVTGPDGKPIEIPAGVDRKAFVGEISRANAKAAAGEKTGEQAKAEGFANKMELANKSIGALEGQGGSLAGKIASGIPLGNYVQSPEYQRYKQASSNFITALLRQESGAAIGKAEFDRYDREYMPQPGDGPEVLVQKAEARRVAIDAMKKGAGPGYKSPAAEPGKVRVYNPTTGRIE